MAGLWYSEECAGRCGEAARVGTSNQAVEEFNSRRRRVQPLHEASTVRLFVLPKRSRVAIFSLVTAGTLAAGACLCSSPSGVFHLAVAVIFTAYVVLLRGEWLGRISARHVAYFVALSGSVAAYLLALSQTSPSLGLPWRELPLALFFLASVHIVIGLADHLVNVLLSAAFRLGRDARRPWRLYVPKSVLRLLFVLAFAAVYLTATFMTHWVGLTDGTDPERYFQAKCAADCQAVRFEGTDGLDRVGWFVRSADPASDATVILMPGRSQSRSSSLSYAQMLREAGYNVFFLDLRSEGAAGGHTRSFGVLEAAGVLGALRHLKQAHPAASRYVFGFGISHGAAAVAHAAARDGRIRAVVLDSAFAGTDPILGRIASLLPAPIGRCFRNATLLVASAELGCNLFRAGARHSVGRIAPRPVMLVHGLADTTSPPEAGEDIRAAARGPAALWLVPEAGHGEPLLHGWEEYRYRVDVLFESVRGEG